MPDLLALPLQQVTPAAEIEEWIAGATAGERRCYAIAADYPRGSEAARVAGAMKDAGSANLFSKRDEADPSLFRFIIEKRPEPQKLLVQPERRGGQVERAQAALLLDLLRRCAERHQPCPSNAEIARKLQLRRSPQRGRYRAKYLLDLLKKQGRIAVETRGKLQPRVVTILAKGRAQGKETKR